MKRCPVILALTVPSIMLIPATAFAHDGHPHPALSLTLDPWIVTPLVIIALLYGRGQRKLGHRSCRGQRRLARSSLSFWSGWSVLTFALVSPLHELGEKLFSMHMIEHELIMALAAPLMVLSRPLALMLWGLPQTARALCAKVVGSRPLRSTWSRLTGGTLATFLHGVAIWAWHAPPLFDAAVTNIGLHRLQHLSFFLSALIFWWAVLWTANRGMAVWHLFVTMMHMSLLGALITLAPDVRYQFATRDASAWGMTPLEDQQIAGLIMWVPAGIVYAGAALALMALWIHNSAKGGPDGTQAAHH